MPEAKSAKKVERTVSAKKHPTVSLLWERSRRDSAEFIERHMDTAMLFKSKAEMHRYAINNIPPQGMILEFGVRAGTSINHFADQLAASRDKRKIFGFDSFEGLSEKWVGQSTPAGAFSVGGVLPDVRKNVGLIKGWIDDTLPKFLEENPGPIAFINIDTDTVSPCRTILELCKPRLASGSVVLFDELLSYPGWRHGEYLALQEKLEPDSYEFEAFSGFEAMIRIKDVDAEPRARPVSTSSSSALPMSKAKLASAEVLDFSRIPELRYREEIARFTKANSIGIELGVAAGAFSSQLLTTGRFSHLYSVDMWAGDRGHNVDQYKRVITRLSQFRDKNTIIKMKFDEALDLFPDEYFDFIYIDGYAHTGQEEGRTLTDWWPKLKRGGIFAGDDYSKKYPLVIREVDEFARANQLQLHVYEPPTATDKWFQNPSWITRKP